jgi:hypothetical protein
MVIIFPVKLHKLLCEANRNGHEDIISWLPDGKSFKVHDKTKLANEIMPCFFGSSKYRSFQKNLNMWNFTFQRRGGVDGVHPHTSKGACFHPLFLRDSPSLLCHRMIRQLVCNKRNVIDLPNIHPPPPPSYFRGNNLVPRNHTEYKLHQPVEMELYESRVHLRNNYGQPPLRTFLELLLKLVTMLLDTGSCANLRRGESNTKIWTLLSVVSRQPFDVSKKTIRRRVRTLKMFPF